MTAKIVIQKTSLVDFPGRVSSVFFFPGCNLCCPWCHNRDLVTGEALGLKGIEDGFSHIKKRREVLGGVVLSGGEPCLQNELPDFIAEIKKIPLAVKLDTNGMVPAMLEKLFARKETSPDYISLDLKIAPARYEEISPGFFSHKGTMAQCEKNKQKKNLGDKLIESAALIRKSCIAHEYRTLALPSGFITESDIEALAPLADNSPWYFRPFRGGNSIDPAWDSLEENPGMAKAHTLAFAKKARELGKNGICPD